MRRRGLTLIELVVVIAIVGLLAVLILAGVQTARESGRRIQCQTNLKQFGIAIHSYTDAYGVFPPSRTAHSFSFHVALLPQLEQAPLYSQIDFSSGPGAPQNAVVRSMYIAALHCPSDGLRTTYATNYAGNYGKGVQKFGYDGLFRLGYVYPADIKDGLSHTAAISEALIASNALDPGRVVWQTPAPMLAADQLEIFATTCAAMAPPAPALTQVRGVPWLLGDAVHTLYNHVLTPNQPSCTNGTRVQEGAYTANSSHPGGVNLLYVDGHVVFITQEIDRNIWRASGSRNGNEALF